MITVDIPIKDTKKPPKLTLPERCVHCGRPGSKTVPVRLNTGAQKRGQIIQLEMDVPLCAECAAKENHIANVTWIPFFVAGVLTSIIVFIPVSLMSPEGTTPQTYAFPFVLGAFVGMIAGIVVGTLLELVLRMLLTPAYGTLLLKRPLTALSIFNDSEDLLGLSTRLTKDKKTVKLIFENDEIAREFISLNPQEN
jgi:hypothetical protein